MRYDLLALRGQFTEDEGVGNHVVDGMAMDIWSAAIKCSRFFDSLAVGKVVKRTLLVDDPLGGLLGADPDALDVVRGLAEFLELGMDDVSSLDGGLGVEFSGVGDLEEDILHDVGAVGDLELKGLALRKRKGLEFRETEIGRED